jgi:predicted amidohydrolase
MKTLKTLLVQAQLGWKDPLQNREHLEALLAGVDGSFDLAVFPETFTTGFLGDNDVDDEGMDGQTVEWMKRLAARHESAIAGSLTNVTCLLLVEKAGAIQPVQTASCWRTGAGESTSRCATTSGSPPGAATVTTTT